MNTPSKPEKPPILSIRWRVDKNGHWYGFMLEEERKRYGFKTCRVELCGAMPKSLKEGEIWYSRLANTGRYCRQDHPEWAYVEATPLSLRPHPDAWREASTRIRSAKQQLADKLTNFAQATVDQRTAIGIESCTDDVGWLIQSELNRTSGSLARRWDAFLNGRLISSIIEPLLGCIHACPCNSCSFVVTNLDEAIRKLGQPKYKSDPRYNGALAEWQDAEGNVLQALVPPGQLLLVANQMLVTNLHRQGNKLIGELNINELADSTVICQFVVANGEQLIEDKIVPVTLTEEAMRLSSVLNRDRILEALRETGLQKPLKTYKAEALLQKLESEKLESNIETEIRLHRTRMFKAAREFHLQKAIGYLVKQRKEFVGLKNKILELQRTELAKSDPEYASRPNPHLYCGLATTDEDAVEACVQECQRLLKKIERLTKFSLALQGLCQAEETEKGMTGDTTVDTLPCAAQLPTNG